MQQEAVHDQEEKKEIHERVETHKAHTRNHSDKIKESEGPPFKKYYSLIAIGGTVFVMTTVLIWLSCRAKEEKEFKKSA